MTAVSTETPSASLTLSDVSETGLLTLYCRAIETQSADPILKDPLAVEITQRLNPLLMSSGKPFLQNLAQGKVKQNLVVHINLRARKYDEYACDFLARHPDGIIVSLGCGMDSRFYRIDNGSVTFFDVDLPDVIRFKRQVIQENERYQMIGASVFDRTWMEPVMARGPRPVLFLAEGLFMYLDGEKVRDLVLELQSLFPGAELVCEVSNRQVTSGWLRKITRHKMQRQLRIGGDATLTFGISESRELETWNRGIEFIEDWSYFDTQHPRIGWIRWLGKVDIFRKIQWTVRYRLNQAG